MSQHDILADLRLHINESSRITADTQLRDHVDTTFKIQDNSTLPLITTLEEAQQFIGQEVGVTKWFEVSHELSNNFVKLTGDYQFIHFDSEKTREQSAFHGAVAHGMLIITLLSSFAKNSTLRIRDTRHCIIYGMDQVRFLSPVYLGRRIRGRFTLRNVQPRKENEIFLQHSAIIEIEGEEKPALKAEWSVLAVL